MAKFQNSYTVGLSTKLSIKTLPYFPPYLKTYYNLFHYLPKYKCWNFITVRSQLLTKPISHLERETPASISSDLWPSNVQIWSQLTAKFMEKYSSGYNRQKFMTLINCSSVYMLCPACGLEQMFLQNVINDAINEWCKRIYACIRAKGGYTCILLILLLYC